MSKNHLKRLNAPKTWVINRKENKWITKQNPGPHSLKESMPINVILKNLLKYSKTTRETKNILNKKEILINKKAIKDVKYPVGILDIIEIPRTKEYFLFLLSKKGKFFLQKIEGKISDIKHLKISGKKVLKKNKLQLNFSNGNNLITDKKDYKVGDSLLININDKKIINHIKLDKGSTVYLIGGKYTGSTGIIEKLDSSNKSKNDMVELKIDNKKVKTLRKYIFAVDKEVIK
jgi:small subunit ribosomal protein S4e